MIRFFALIYEFVRRDVKIALSYRLQSFFQLAALFTVAVTLFFVSLMLKGVEGNISSLSKYGGSYFAFALVGLAVSIFIDASLRSFSLNIRLAQVTGTFEAMVATRAKIGAIVAGSAAYTLLYSALRGGVMIVLGAWLFRMGVHMSTWPLVLLVLTLTAVTTMALGIFSAGFIVLFKQGDPLAAAISGLSWLLSGVLYPKEILPLWVQQVAKLLPMTHALEAMRLLLLKGAGFAEIQGSLLGLAVFAVIALPVALIWFSWSVDRARVAGSLARF